jgi:hypothetical protein
MTPIPGFLLPSPGLRRYTLGPSGARGGLAESTSFRTPTTINKTGQVLLIPHPGTNSSTRNKTPIVTRITGPVKLSLLEIGVLGGLPIVFCGSPWQVTSLHLQVANLHQLCNGSDYDRRGEACKGNDEW